MKGLTLGTDLMLHCHIRAGDEAKNEHEYVNSVFAIHLATRFATRALTSETVFRAQMEHHRNV